MSTKAQNTGDTPGVDIPAIVKAAIEAAQATQANLAQTISSAIASALQQNQGIRQISVPERELKKIGRTPFNPEHKPIKLDGEYFQNGSPISDRLISPDEAEALKALTPGRFGAPDFPIVVSVSQTVEGNKRVNIRYPEQTQDDRMRQKSYAPNFHAFCVKLAAEAKAQRKQKREEAKALLAEVE